MACKFLEVLSFRVPHQRCSFSCHGAVCLSNCAGVSDITVKKVRVSSGVWSVIWCMVYRRYWCGRLTDSVQMQCTPYVRSASFRARSKEREIVNMLIACTVRQASNAVWFTHARLLSQPITDCHNRADVLLTQSACSPEASAAKGVSI